MSEEINCIGFIMDGNRRWAKEHNLPTLEGHRKGLENLLDIISFIKEEKIPHAVFYAFSTENWKRDEKEVSYLMDLFLTAMDEVDKKMSDENIRVKIIGRRQDFSPELQTRMTELEEKTAQYTAGTVWVGLSYGGRAEIIEAVNEAVKNGEEVTEETFNTLLWTYGMPDPDIIVRTSGEQRLSNFLPWQSVYSELFFTKTLWPALSREELRSILESYKERNRRIGV